ncbi:MAG TPA: histidinol-phosphatase [Vicinamibacterales bacterium]|nr:histidinol-phosphatase [Vicinamibacterales bacterium]
MTPALTDLLDFAVQAAWIAGRRTLAHFQTNVAIDYKADQSPVTIADRSAEQELRELIASRFPDHAILGEEFGEEVVSSPYRWVLDPIDGTQSFVRGVPLYGVLVALEIEGAPRVGVAHFPALNETVAAATGLGCWWNGRRAAVSATAALEDAAVGYSDARTLYDRLGERWVALQRGTRVQRGWGDCYGHCLVATGRLDVMLDPVMNPWDCSALIPILQEAQGTFTDWRGEVTTSGGDAFSTNGRLFSSVLASLA